MKKNNKKKTGSKNYILLFRGLIFGLIVYAIYISRIAKNKSNSAQSNLDLKLDTAGDIYPDNSSNSFTVKPSTLEPGQINFKLNAGADDKILLENLQGDKNDSINIKCDGGGITLNSGFGIITLSNLPTSSSGLTSGQLWNNSGVLNIIT